jgi:leucine dehydrogenase
LQNGGFEHAEVHVCRGKRSGTPFAIAIHTLGDGVALGGCRTLPCDSVEDALADALRLSRAMTYKGAAVGLRHGGGKCVIAVPREAPLKGRLRRATLLDVGDVVDGLGGRFFTGEDAGTTAHDFEIMAERTRYLVGLPRSLGGSGDPSPITASGVIEAMRVSCEHAFGSDRLAGLTVAILGLGKVGGRLARRAARAGANLVVADIDPAKRALAERLGARWVTPDELLAAKAHVLAPCALGGVLHRASVRELDCKVIVGAANNQLAERSIAQMLLDRGILWAPDFIVNAGGLISVASELDGYTPAEVRRRTRAIGSALRQVFADAEREGVTTLHAAERYAERKAVENAESAPDEAPMRAPHVAATTPLGAAA